MKMHSSTLFTRRQFALVATLSAGLFLAGCGSVSSVDAALRDPDKNSAIKPEPRDPAWMRRHDGFVAIAKTGNVDVLFLGDSITDFWRREPTTQQPLAGKRVFDREFGSWKTANFGISGDRTQHVLWRIENGELDGIKPKVIMLMISTNNTGFERDNTTLRNTPAQAAEGVRQIIGKIREKLPKTKILLLAVFPRGEKPDNPQRKQVNEINAIISKFDDGKNVRFLDINQQFLTPDGTLTKDIMPDFLHPVEKGYEIWAAAVKEPLTEMSR